MEEILLLCAPLETLAQLHAVLRQVLCLPDCYGENFDALYDCLTERGIPTHLEVRDLTQSDLGTAGCVFRQVLLDAAENNPNFCVSFTQTPPLAELPSGTISSAFPQDTGAPKDFQIATGAEDQACT